MLSCIAMLFGGAYAAVVFHLSLRGSRMRALADKPRALSLVLAGGVFAGCWGGQLVTTTMNINGHRIFACGRHLPGNGAHGAVGPGAAWCAVCGHCPHARCCRRKAIGPTCRRSPIRDVVRQPRCGGHAVRRGQLHADELHDDPGTAGHGTAVRPAARIFQLRH